PITGRGPAIAGRPPGAPRLVEADCGPAIRNLHRDPLLACSLRRVGGYSQEPTMELAQQETAGAPMIRMENVEKSYPYKGGRTWVLRQITLDIAEGDFVTIMGPSGSGKSTLLAILGMLDGEFEGEYYFDGKPVHKSSVKERNRL